MSVAADDVAEPRGLRERVAAAQTETTVAVAGFAAIALHALDDTVFQPEPGTSAADRAGRRRLRGRRAQVGTRRHHRHEPGQGAGDRDQRRADRRDGAVRESPPPAEPEDARGPDRVAGVLHLRDARRRGEDNNPAYYEAARGPKQIWRIDTSHTHGLSARPREYERRVVGFFDRTLLGK